MSVQGEPVQPAAAGSVSAAGVTARSRRSPSRRSSSLGAGSWVPRSLLAGLWGVGVLLGAAAPVRAAEDVRPHGEGIKAGDFVLHPEATALVGYDSNYFQRSGDNYGAESPIVSAWRFRLRPAIEASNMDPRGTRAAAPRLRLSLGGYAAYNELTQANSTNPSADLGAQRNIELGALGAAVYNADGQFSPDFGGSFERLIEPSNTADSYSAWDRDSLKLRTGLSWIPLPSVFRWRLGYGFTYNWFEADAFQNLDNVQHVVESTGSFRFLPRTALLYDARYAWLRYTANNAGHNNGESITSHIGIRSLITQQVLALALVGWSSSFYTPSGGGAAYNYDSIVGQGEVRYLLRPDAKLQAGEVPTGIPSVGAGVSRSYSVSYIGDYYEQTRFYVDGSARVGQRLSLDATASYARITRPPVQAGLNVVAGPAENRVSLTVGAEYTLAKGVGAVSQLRYDSTLGSPTIDVQQADPTQSYRDNLGYGRFQAWLGLRLYL